MDKQVCYCVGATFPQYRCYTLTCDSGADRFAFDSDDITGKWRSDTVTNFELCVDWIDVWWSESDTLVHQGETGSSIQPKNENARDLSPLAPTFIWRVLGLNISLFRVWRARWAWSPQIAHSAGLPVINRSMPNAV